MINLRPDHALQRIYRDFNTLYGEKTAGVCSAPLVCAGTRRDLDALHLTLEDGMEVVLYQPDDVAPDGTPDCLEVRAKIRFDPKAQCFMGDFVWDKLMYRSESEAQNERA